MGYHVRFLAACADEILVQIESEEWDRSQSYVTALLDVSTGNVTTVENIPEVANAVMSTCGKFFVYNEHGKPSLATVVYRENSLTKVGISDCN